MRRLNAAAALLLLTAITGFAQREEPRSVWDGVYTAEQAKRGEKLYVDNCAGCHGPDLAGAGIITPLAGAGFVKDWDGKSVGELFERQRTTMPTDDPTKLTREQHVEVLSYVLKMNGFPAGAAELPREAERLNAIRMEDATRKK